MHLDRRACDRARRSRDARFDGRFFIGVTTTRIYCRPICPARAPKDEHIRYFPSAAAAEMAGFRPCLRCRPEASPGTPAWFGTSTVVSRALRLIGDGALDEDSVETLAGRLGVTGRHLRRLFLQHLGAPPLHVALTRRTHVAKTLIDHTGLPLHQVAHAAGFGSVRRFNSQMRRAFGRTPGQLRARAHAHPHGHVHDDAHRLVLAYRPPYNWDAIIAFLSARATPGVELVEPHRYRRTIVVGDQAGIIEVRRADRQRTALTLEVRIVDAHPLLTIVERVRRMFDLGADPALIAEHLGTDPMLGPRLDAQPGIRTPGAWDAFELAVRAVLGQQVSVRAATTVAGRIAESFGSPIGDEGGLSRLFPSAAQLADAPVERTGVMPARADTIRALARAVVEGRVSLHGGVDPHAAAKALTDLPGIGPWTASYIAMRAFGEPDAFPSGDLVLRQAAGGCTARELEAMSQAWRPWRSYAVMLLWQAPRTESIESARRIHALQDGDGGRSGGNPGGGRHRAARRAAGTRA